MATENNFPTIKDYRDLLSDVIDKGFGDLPVQILVVPDSTLQALARHRGERDSDKPAIMMQWLIDPARLPVSFISAGRLKDCGMPTTTTN